LGRKQERRNKPKVIVEKEEKPILLKSRHCLLCGKKELSEWFCPTCKIAKNNIADIYTDEASGIIDNSTLLNQLFFRR
jgi:hypothetical protein